ncbi:hypothetical protein NADFUDRAFT_81613, partial [Nadsonia fulvescens var. elongata DSM 6958]
MMLTVREDRSCGDSDSNASGSSTKMKSRVRSRMGCLICRRRKKRCDERRPTCEACKRLNLVCEYPKQGQERINRKPRLKRVFNSENHLVEYHSASFNTTDLNEFKGTMPYISPEVGSMSTRFGEYSDTTFQSPMLSSEMSHFENFSPVEHNIPLAVSDIGSMLPKPITHEEAILSNGTKEFPRDNFGMLSPLDIKSSLTSLYETTAEDDELLVQGNYSDELKYIYQQQERQHQIIQNIQPSILQDLALSRIPNAHFSQFHMNLASFPLIAASDTVSAQLLEYYQTHLAPLVCVSTEQSNFFLSVFIPMAQYSKPVLYGLLAWAAVHRGLSDDIGASYLRLTLHSIQQQQEQQKDSDQSILPLANETLAAILLIGSAEICRGDMVKWAKRYRVAADIITARGGLKAFLGSNKEERWLVSNFAYHDLLSASANARGSYFDYDDLLMTSRFGLDPLLGCCQPLFGQLAKISKLGIRSKQLFLKLQQQQAFKSVTIDNCDEFDFRSELKSIMKAAGQLDTDIEHCQPNSHDLQYLTSLEIEQQLTLFETFQIAAQLHLKQLVVRLNPTSLEMQILAANLIGSLDIILKTPVEGMLCFPLFIAGINTTSSEKRAQVIRRFDGLHKRNFARNILRVKQLLEEVWTLDAYGAGYVDWYEV